MSRLKRRLERQRGNEPQSPTKENAEVQYQQELPPQSPLVQEYEELQQKAEDYDKELQAIDATNPHSLYKEIVTNPSPKNKFLVRIMGRPIDLAKLENYVVHKISPKTITTLMRYNDVRSIEDIKGYSKVRPLRMKSGIIWIIIGMAVILIAGYILMTTDITGLMSGMFGGI